MVSRLFQYTMLWCDESLSLSYADTVTDVVIQPPVQAAESASAPTGIDLVFKASIKTQYNTKVIGDVSYVWDFGDGSGSTTTGNITSHTFGIPMTYNITVKIIAPYSSAEKRTYQLHVYESKATPRKPHPLVLIPHPVARENVFLSSV